jgi:hypothetical protein
MQAAAAPKTSDAPPETIISPISLDTNLMALDVPGKKLNVMVCRLSRVSSRPCLLNPLLYKSPSSSRVALISFLSLSPTGKVGLLGKPPKYPIISRAVFSPATPYLAVTRELSFRMLF